MLARSGSLRRSHPPLFLLSQATSRTARASGSPAGGCFRRSGRQRLRRPVAISRAPRGRSGRRRPRRTRRHRHAAGGIPRTSRSRSRAAAPDLPGRSSAGSETGAETLARGAETRVRKGAKRALFALQPPCSAASSSEIGGLDRCIQAGSASLTGHRRPAVFLARRRAGVSANTPTREPPAVCSTTLRPTRNLLPAC